uniref:PDZ domain-containing protein n=1 Tax=Wuchereria bancrofti TaxID=6293 RepID=A0AAF5PLB3_WUCBA
MPRSSLRQKSCKGNKRANNFPTKIAVTVILKKPFGLRINKGDLRVTLVESRGSSVGQVGVGDKIIAINHEKLLTVKDLNEQLSKPGKNARVTLERCGFSCCKHMITTVETLTVEKGSSLKVLRAVEVYMVQIRIESFPDMDLSQELGLSVKYDNKEQLQVAGVIPGSLASVHLRPGDIIKEVNGEYITSKTMLAFWIRHGFDTKRQIQILVQTGVEDDPHIEMPEDVQQIAQKQLTILRSKKLPKSMISLMKQTNSLTGKHITISMEEPKEMGICSDYDETTLRHVHKNK